MRLFIAIETDEKVKEYLKSLQDKIISHDAKLSVSKGYHLTLKFLGDVPETNLEEIKAKLSEIKFTKFRLTTSDIGFFPDAKNPRVIWLGLEPHQEVKKLQQNIDNALLNLGFEKDSRFHPHLTLARVKFVKNKNYPEMIKQLKTESIAFDVGSFVLFKSDLKPEWPVYTELLRINLE